MIMKHVIREQENGVYLYCTDEQFCIARRLLFGMGITNYISAMTADPSWHSWKSGEPICKCDLKHEVLINVEGKERELFVNIFRALIS